METDKRTQNDIQVKIDLVRLTTSKVLNADVWNEQAESIVSVLRAYERSLVRYQLNIPNSFDDVDEMNQAIRDAGCLVVDIGRRCHEYMQGWYHGKTPDNVPQAFANLLSRAIWDLSLYVNVFERQFPSLKETFDAERRHHAQLIQEQEDREEAERAERYGS